MERERSEQPQDEAAKDFNIGRWFLFASAAMDDVAGWVIPELVERQMDDVQALVFIAGVILIAFQYLTK